eukprot:XP_001690690.1 predicted protein [Chlamydomonas reinhardtii]
MQQQQQQPGGPAAPINARVARGISGLFGQSLLADCQLVFVQERGLLGQQPGPHGAASSSTRAPPGRELGLGQRCGEPLPAHSIVLRFASDKLAAQLDWPASPGPVDISLSIVKKNGPKATATSTSSTAASVSAPAAATAIAAAAKAQLPILQVMVGGEEELPAARAAIQFAYTGRVEAGGSGIREVLQVRRQAAYLQMEGCVEACLAAVREQLLKAGGGGAGVGAAAGASASTNAGGGAASHRQMPSSSAVLELYSCSDVWPDPAEDAAFAALLTEAKTQLVAHFGDALAVLNKQKLYDQMRALPVEGMEALLESDDFGTDSESSVVLVLAEWMAANHSRTDAATRRRLCGLLRLSQCSRAYLGWVLPALAAAHEASPGSAGGWLPMTRDDATCLLTYSTAMTVQERFAMRGNAAMRLWPANWLSTQRRRQCLTAEGREISFNASLADLTKAFGGMKSWSTGRLDPILADARHVDHFAAQGWEWNPYVDCWTSDAAADIWEAPADQPAGGTASGPTSGSASSSGVVAARWSRYLLCGVRLTGSVTLLLPPLLLL